jgi:serralysin
VFKFQSLAEIGNSITFETITDFTSGDKINFTAIDANSNLANDQAFKFVGLAAFSGIAGELRYESGFLQGDVDGDLASDFSLQLIGSPALVASDFYL